MNLPHSILRDGEPAAGGGAAPAGGAPAGGTPPAGGAPAGGGTPNPGGAAPVAPVAPAPFYKGLYGEDGKIDKAALDRLPDHLKPAKDWIAKYDTIDALLGGGWNANQLASKKQLTPLEQNAPDHVKSERKQMLDVVNGVPKEPKGYGIERPQDFPQEHWNQPAAEKFADIAHRHSLPPGAVKELLALQLESTNAELARGQQMEAEFYKNQDAAFAKGAHASGIQPDRALELATRGANTLGIDPKSPIFKNAEVRLALMKMTSLVSEDKLVTGEATPAGGQDYRALARDIMGNSANPLNRAWADSGHPQHDEAKERVNQLYRLDHEQKTRKRGATP